MGTRLATAVMVVCVRDRVSSTAVHPSITRNARRQRTSGRPFRLSGDGHALRLRCRGHEAEACFGRTRPGRRREVGGFSTRLVSVSPLPSLPSWPKLSGCPLIFRHLILGHFALHAPHLHLRPGRPRTFSGCPHSAASPDGRHLVARCIFGVFPLRLDYPPSNSSVIAVRRHGVLCAWILILWTHIPSSHARTCSAIPVGSSHACQPARPCRRGRIKSRTRTFHKHVTVRIRFRMHRDTPRQRVHTWRSDALALATPSSAGRQAVCHLCQPATPL
jgi:hypothetical protein